MSNKHSEALDVAAIGAVADLYHRFLTGLMLALASRAGVTRGAEVVFRSFRRQQQEKFLPGLKTLSLEGLPPAVACAQYHYLSNALGGAKVEWIGESDRKSWVRYAPPRWIFDGTALCGIPTEFSRAMLRGWHANNGVLLNNLRLGFVCTAQTTDGGPGAIGYYIEEDRELAPDERLRFSPGERPPPATPHVLPTVDWDAERLLKVKRNYCMEYVRSMLLAMNEVLGPADAVAIGRIAARQIGMQFHDAVCDALGHPRAPEDAVGSFATLLARLCAAQNDAATMIPQNDGSLLVVTQSWRFAQGLSLPAEGFEVWNGLWEGLAAVHGRGNGVNLLVIRRADLGDADFCWRLRAN